LPQSANYRADYNGCGEADEAGCQDCNGPKRIEKALVQISGKLKQRHGSNDSQDGREPESPHDNVRHYRAYDADCRKDEQTDGTFAHVRLNV
jgi:hypothetical protein